ncbi:transposase [Streptomyces sp. 7R015]|uniref:Transposase n=1 Tax=Streptomyces cylindrosporus TaxID=2927583 RepID=A0ABS9YHY2_9ACTN|nr:transposase [Streptomyces cylindrosporus]
MIEPALAAWHSKRRGRALDWGSPRRDLREITNAILHVDRTGDQWASFTRLEQAATDHPILDVVQRPPGTGGFSLRSPSGQ